MDGIVFVLDCIHFMRTALCQSMLGERCRKSSQQGHLVTYLIPGCVGRGVRLGSESSSGGVWKSGNMEIWEPGNQEM